MSEDDVYEKRISLSLPIDKSRRLKDVIPWGLQGQVLRKLLDMLIELFDRDGASSIHLLLSGELTMVSKSSLNKSNTSTNKSQTNEEDTHS